MWMWGVRFKSMEKTIQQLSILGNYRNRQVILNYYQEDCLWERDGFEFCSLRVKNGDLVFEKLNNKKPLMIPTQPYHKYVKNGQFPNYYILYGLNSGDRLEIYFP